MKNLRWLIAKLIEAPASWHTHLVKYGDRRWKQRRFKLSGGW